MQIQTLADFPEDDDRVDEWFEYRESPILNVLVGLPKCGKTLFAEKYGLQGFDSSCFTGKINSLNLGRVINIVDNYIDLEEISTGIENKESFIWDAENLSVEDRRKVLDMFPDNYVKVAIIWEVPESELILRGCNPEEIKQKGKNYERPSTREDFHEFVYIL